MKIVHDLNKKCNILTRKGNNMREEGKGVT
jgi:hypothetical protein